MAFRKLRRSDEEEVRAFLAPLERDCVAASEAALAFFSGGNDAVQPSGVWGAADSSGKIRGLLTLSPYGSLSALLDGAFPTEELSVPLRQCAAGRLRLGSLRGSRARGGLSSVQGRAVDTAQIQRALRESPYGLAPTEEQSFAIMSGEEPAPAELRPFPPGLDIRTASPDDEELLLPLQAAYEVEEVLPPSATHNRAACRLALARSLRTRLVLVAELEGRAVGKAGINASGMAWDQIGGVYVAPEFRGGGIGARLAWELKRRVEAKGRRATLFVKQANGPAVAAYRRAGFSLGPAYRIAYY